ncbi:hypothetical protein NUT41_08045 [Staphylococcus warneri]|uniref:hypothetical protein n=1 Tax=Staphylococcus warneri TaxID=1292 RepID=UPI0021AE21CB|nr:hypothetical protein [Staphylococcus warneri]UUY68660.1 hypothetical protein NUT41_08045 [Staphylococcus warneri]
MDKEKVFKKLDEAKSQNLAIKFGYLKPTGNSNDLKDCFQITYEYDYNHISGKIDTTDFHTGENRSININAITGFECLNGSLLVLVYEDRA